MTMPRVEEMHMHYMTMKRVGIVNSRIVILQ